MPDVFSDSPGKRAVRELWNTRFLRHIADTRNVRFRYLGLPGVDILDLKLWKDMIEEIVAFQMSDEPTDDDEDGRRSYVAMQTNLARLQIPNRTFRGSMEEVVLLGSDYDGQPYRQERVVTLYNLDFCDQIGSAIETRELGRRVLRYEALRQLIQDQQRAKRLERTGSPSRFVMLITVRNQMDARQLQSLLASSPWHDTRAYVDQCQQMLPLPPQDWVLGTHGWALKALIHDFLRLCFSNPALSAIFFPVVKYVGTPVHVGHGELMASPMLHFMVWCSFGRREAPRPAFSPGDFLTSGCSVRAHDNHSLRWEPEPGETVPAGPAPDPVQWWRERTRSETARGGTA